MPEEKKGGQDTPVEEKAAITRLGELVGTEAAMEYIGNPNEATFLRLRKHHVYMPNRGGDDGRKNLYFINCLKVRYAVFDDLKRRRIAPRFTQAMIGDLFDSEFGEADQYLIDQLFKRNPDEIIASVIKKYTK